MISSQVVKELGLKIEAPSSSLIVSATGPSVRPLGIIKNLSIEIEGTTIPMDVEVMNATSYSLLLGNDWSQKVDATYSWKNKAYTLRWNKKKIHVPTTYEHDQPLPAQPTITDEKELEKFEQEYLRPKEAYVVEIEPDNWTTVTHRSRPSASFTKQKCGRCYSYNHLYADCPNNECYRCRRYGHLAAHCPKQAPKRNVCKTCSQPGHLYKDCPDNLCYQCKQYGHISANCPLMTQILENQQYQCGCQPQEVNANRLPHFSPFRVNHCCKCKVPKRPEEIRPFEQTLICKGCWIDFHQDLDPEDPRSIEFFTNGEGRGTLTECKLCREQGIRSKMIKLDSIREDTRFCNLECLYAYKAAKDVEWNSNYNLWTRVRHYTESTRNAGHAYDLNQSRIYRLAQIQIGESNEDLAHALEPQAADLSNQDYTYNEVNVIMRASQVQLSETEEETLQRILEESFDTSHPDFDQRKAMENLQRNFQGTVGLCKECIMAKKNTELEQFNSYCEECYKALHPPPDPEVLSPPTSPTPELPIVAPIKTVSTTLEPTDLVPLLQEQIRQQAQIIALLQEQAKTFEHQDQTIKELQARVNYFENFHHRLRDLYNESSSSAAFDDSDAQNF